MIKKLYLILIFTSISSVAQQKVDLKFTYENTSSLLSYLKENNVQYDLKDLGTLFGINDFVYLNNNKLLRVPRVYFFNAEGERIVQEFSTASCGQTLKNIEKLLKGKTDSSDNLSKWLNLIEFSFTKDEIFTESYDLYAVIFYGKWGDYSLEEANLPAFNWYNSIKEFKGKLKIKPILVSLDVMDNWTMSDEQKKALHLN